MLVQTPCVVSLTFRNRRPMQVLSRIQRKKHDLIELEFLRRWHLQGFPTNMDIKIVPAFSIQLHSLMEVPHCGNEEFCVTSRN